MPKQKYTEDDKDIVIMALEILKKRDKTLPPVEEDNATDNDTKCICEGISLNPECPVHRVVG